MEREKQVKISEGEFKASLLTKRQTLLNMATNGELTPEDAEVGILAIQNAMDTVNEALAEDLKVKYYQKGDELSFSIEAKKKIGFI